jgi:hypothetical protein
VRTRALLGGLVLLAPAGCAFERGEPTGVVAASFRGEYASIPERDAGDGWQSLVGPAEVRIDAAALGLDAVTLVAEVGPEDDASQAVVATLATPAAADLLTPAAVTLDCATSCILGPGRLIAARATVASLVLDGSIRTAGTLDATSLVVRFDAAGPTMPAVVAGLDETIDEDEPPGVALALELSLDATLFDALELGDLERDADGAVEISSRSNADALATIATHLAGVPLGVTVSRTD